MKNIFLFILFLVNVLKAQNDPIIEALDNPDVLIRQNTLSKIEEEMLVQYTSALEKRIFTQPAAFLEFQYLDVLYALNSSNIESIALQFIELAGGFNYEYSSRDPLEAKVLATRILFALNNYSTIDYVYEVVERDKPNINQDAFTILVEILNKLPQYEDYAKEELLYILYNNNELDFNRYYALSSLERKFGSELLSDYVNVFEGCPFISVRTLALEFLFKYSYPSLQILLSDRLSMETEWSLRDDIANSLLKKFGEPFDLKTVIDHQSLEPNVIAKSLMQITIDRFIPPKPETLNWNGLATKLITYTDEIYGYGWITNEATKDFYTTKLQDIITLINQTNEIDSACTIINTVLLPQVEQGLQEKLITTEGYKFLHYYTIYIKEEIEKELGPCQ